MQEQDQPTPEVTDAGDGYAKAEFSKQTNVGTIHTHGSVVNFGDARTEAEPKAVTGPIGKPEIDRLLADHAPRSIDSMVGARLASDHCLILTGEPGTGRRTGAVKALVAQIGGSALVEVGLNAADVTKLEVEDTCGYVLDASSVAQPASKFGAASLRSVQDRLQQHNSYLVIIGLRSKDWQAVDDAFTVSWEPVTLSELLQVRQFDPPVDEESEQLASVLGDTPSVAKMASVVERLADGRSRGLTDEEVLAEQPDGNRAEIRQWLAEPGRSLDQWALLSVLAFFSSSSKAEFSILHRHLLTRLDEEIPPGEDEAEVARSDLARSVVGELEACRAEVRSSKVSIDGISVRRQIVCFAEEKAAPVYLEEYWKAVPQRLQHLVFSWLMEIWKVVENRDEIAERLAGRVAHLVDGDADLSLAVIEHWASTADPSANELAARTVDLMAAANATRPVAFAVARDWAKSTTEIPKQYSALYVYTGRVGLFQIRQAIRVYRRQFAKRPFWTSGSWAGFTAGCAEEQSQAEELVRAVLNVGVVRDGKIDDPMFHLIDRWFVDQLDVPPLALELASTAKARHGIASIVAASLRRSHRHQRWLESIIPWADCEDHPEYEAASLALLRACVLSVALTPEGSGDTPDPRRRANSISRDLERFMTNAKRRKNGPTQVAIDRCTAVLHHVSAQLERKPTINA